MTCPACTGDIEPGKILLCSRCFTSLPLDEQVSLRNHYMRIVQNVNDARCWPRTISNHLSRCVDLIRANAAAATAAQEKPQPGSTPAGEQ
jgi:hypothetical protein